MTDGRPLRIDYVVGGLRITLGPESTTPGPAQHIENFTSAARSLGHDVRIYQSAQGPGLRRLGTVREGQGSSTSLVRRAAGDGVRLIASLLNAARVRSWSRSSEATVVYERLSVLQFLGRWHRRYGVAPLVVESNGIMSRESAGDRKALLLTRWAERVERRAYRRADLVVAVSPGLAAEVVSFAAIDPARVLVVPNGVDAELCRRELPPKETVIGFTGAVVEWQGLGDLLRAVARLDASCDGASSGWAVEVVGDGPALAGLVGLAAELGLESRVRFFGRLPRAQAHARMARWSAGFCGHTASTSAVMYHSPLKLYEYLGLGVHPLSTRSADAVALAQGGQPISFFADADSLHEALVALVRAPPSDPRETERARLALCSRHSWQHRVHEVLDALQQPA